MRRWLAISSAVAVATALAVSAQVAAAQPTTEAAAPPPVSGRTLAVPDSITAADVLARVRLVHAHLEQIRQYMGRPSPPAPLMEVSDVTVRQAFFATLNLKRRALTLGFEQLRTPQRFTGGLTPTIRAAEALGIVNEVLLMVLAVKAELKISATATERPAPETTTMTDVFRQLLATGALVNSLLNRRTKSEDIYLVTTILVHQSMRLHRHYTRKLMPDEPAFEPNKKSSDVLDEYEKLYPMVRELSDGLGLKLLGYRRADAKAAVSPDHVSDLGVLLIGALDNVSGAAGLPPDRRAIGSFGRKFPSHAVQRARLVRKILTDIVEARRKAK